MNTYHNAVVARLALALENNVSASNEKKLRKLALAVSNNEFASYLEDAKVDASELASNAIYEIEKTIKFASQAIKLNAKDLNANTYAIFRTAINCYKHNVALTQAMIEASISRDIEVADEHKHLVYARNIIQTSETVAAQTQTSRRALLALNIIVEKADQKQAYTVKLSKLTRALAKQFELDVSKVA